MLYWIFFSGVSSSLAVSARINSSSSINCSEALTFINSLAILSITTTVWQYENIKIKQWSDDWLNFCAMLNLCAFDVMPKHDVKRIISKCHYENLWYWRVARGFLRISVAPIEKKPNATDCGDFRTISLLGHAAKVMLKILTKRIEAKVQAIGHIGED